ncbi:MAG: TrkA family potassium uptake protein [Chloroflexi bacterium]|nr:TrkA family potassium uptake protein [Chloroflexota bacterium]
MRVIIMGCGRIGSHIATTLWRHNHQVTVMDTEPESFLLLPPEMVEQDGTTLVGDGTLEDDLHLAGIDEAEVFVAVSVRDSRNALAAQKAKHIFSVPRVVCRIGDPVRQEMYRNLGMEAVSPTESTSTSILRAVEF